MYCSKQYIYGEQLLCIGFSTLALGLVYPLDVAATYFASDMRSKVALPLHSSIVDFLRKSNLYFGIKSLYKGLSLSVLTSVPYYCFAFASCKIIKEYTDKLLIRKSMPAWYKLGAYLFCPIGASLTTAVLFYPFETIIRNYQISGLFDGAREYTGIKECAKELMKARALYNGIGYNIMRVLLGVIVQISVANAVI
jgi:Mitochondrial carrier protein